MRTDSTEAMVAQLIRLVADLQVALREQNDAIAGQQQAMEELAKMVMRQAGQAWQQNNLAGYGELPQ